MQDDDLVFPAEIRDRGVVLGGEYAWSLNDAIRLIEYLRRRLVAVVGVEVWLAEGNRPRVVTSSDYEVPRHLDWRTYVDESAREAAADLAKRILPPGALINLTWLTETQAADQDDR